MRLKDDGLFFPSLLGLCKDHNVDGKVVQDSLMLFSLDYDSYRPHIRRMDLRAPIANVWLAAIVGNTPSDSGECVNLGYMQF